MTEDTSPELSLLTATIVAAYVSNNKLNPADLTDLIGSTYQALSTAQAPVPDEPETPKPDKAAVRKSVQSDYLTSFIDGRRYKSLKRHLSTHGMTPAQYRETYGLPGDYPMVASSYSAQRSALAKSLGLGRKAAGAGAPAPQDETAR
jgi:predicted transcriptional regulator